MQKPDYKNRTAEEPQKPSVPVAMEAEKAAISCILQNHDVLDAARWDDSLFFSESHRILLRLAKRAKHDGRPADMPTLISMAEIDGKVAALGGEMAIMEIFGHYPDPSPEAATFFRKDLMHARKFRKGLEIVSGKKNDIQSMNCDLREIAREFTEVADDEDAKTQTLEDTIEELIMKLTKPEKPECFETGIPLLDRILTGGFKRKEVGVVAAETSGGKSILLIQIATEAAKSGKNVVIYSMEASCDQVLQRIASHVCGQNIRPAHDVADSVGYGKLIRETLTKLKALPIEIRDTMSSIEDIEADCRKLKKAGKLDVVVVDYIQLTGCAAKGKNDNREQQVSEVCRRLKLMALELDVCVATASQLNDDGALRESRAIGMHADYVLHISHGDNGSKIHVSKNRNGERNHSVAVKMDGAISKFTWDSKL